MEYQEQQRALSFSVENILREDFPPPSRLSRFREEYSYLTGPQPASLPLYGWCSFCNCLLTPVYARPFSSSLPRQQEGVAPSYCVTVPSELALQRKQPAAKELDRVNDVKHALPVEHAIEENELQASNKEPEVKTTAPVKKKRFRSHFSQDQLQYLEDVFSYQQYLSRDERALLASVLEMTEIQVRNWFQNRRYHYRHRQALARNKGMVPVRAVKQQ